MVINLYSDPEFKRVQNEDKDFCKLTKSKKFATVKSYTFNLENTKHQYTLKLYPNTAFCKLNDKNQILNNRIKCNPITYTLRNMTAVVGCKASFY